MKSQKKRGFIGIIVLIIIALIILGFFNIDVRKVLISPGVQENLIYAWNVVAHTFRYLIDLLVTFITHKRQ